MFSCLTKRVGWGAWVLGMEPGHIPWGVSWRRSSGGGAPRHPPPPPPPPPPNPPDAPYLPTPTISFAVASPSLASDPTAT
jgi:hypothetical protein